uniref:Gp44 n=1 Tax=Mizugakiibacter sediminis TaxID=1475481 RepID=A0A0S6YYJ4_9GAMM
MASVTACGSASVTACDSASVRASKLVAVHKHSARAKISGGVVLDHTGVEKFSADEWCEYHGVKVSRGVATLYKAVNDEWTTSRGVDYSPGSKPACNDFSDTDACGGGLHFGPTPAHALSYFPEATKFVAVGVRVSELRPINGGPAKAKAPRVVSACVEVDIHGKEVT